MTIPQIRAIIYNGKDKKYRKSDIEENMNLNDLNPYIRYARVHYPPYNRKNSDSICYDARFFYIEAASGILFVNGEEYRISDAAAIYLPPRTKYRFQLDHTDESHIYTMDFDLISAFSDIDASLGTATAETFDPTCSPQYEMLSVFSMPLIRTLSELRPAVIACVDAYSSRVPLGRERSSAYLKLCLLELLSENEKSALSPLCRAVISYVQENYSDPSLSNEQIAKALHYSSHHLNLVMQRELGESLHGYLLSHRLEIAKNMLESTDRPISDIAFSIGFCSAAHFTKTFRKAENCTPKAYRALHLHSEI